VQINVCIKIRQFPWRPGHASAVAGYGHITKFSQQLECAETATIPRGCEYRIKFRLYEIFEVTFTQHKVPFDIRPAAGSSELLFFTIDFMVDVAPAMLVPAPQRRFLCLQTFEILPAPAGEPCRDHGQTQGNPVPLENIHQFGKVSPGSGHIVRPKKNVSGTFVLQSFRGDMNTAFGSMNKI
jgi:hypothetical protein